MKVSTLILLAVLLVHGFALRVSAAGTGILVKTFVMAEAEDGKLLTDSFEVWDTNCNLRPTSIAPQARCSITAVSLVQAEGRTHVFTWRHDSESLREVRPNVFRMEMNGRLSQCSGLTVVLRLDQSSDVVESLEGDMRSGTRCQGRRTFSLDKTRSTRTIAPIWNPEYR